jgi:hypothetical protein
LCCAVSAGRISTRGRYSSCRIFTAAGVPVENVTVVVPKDGVYAVMEVRV